MSDANDSGFTFTWKIINYSSNDVRYSEYMSSPVFTSELLSNTKWHLKIYPNGKDGHKDYVACYLCRNDEDDFNGDINISFTIQISDLNGNVFLRMEYYNKFGKGCEEGPKRSLKVDSLSALENSKNNTLVVSCHLFKRYGTNQKVTCDAWTEIQVEECSYKWNVQFSNSPNLPKKLLFHYQESAIFEVTLSVSDNKVHIKVEKKQEKVPSQMNYKVRISALKYEGAKIEFPNNVYLFKPTEEDGLSWFETFFDKQQVVDQEYCSYYSFMLKCDVSSPPTFIVSYIEGYNFDGIVLKENIPSIEVPHQTLQNDLLNMFLKEEHCDVKFRVENEIISAHKCLLAARSPVFSVMFKQEMSESQSGIVDITDVESQVMESFLKFLYSDTLINTGYEHILKLIIVADKYQVLALKERCFPILKSSLTVSNVTEVIAVADLINYEKLKTFVMNFIRENKNEVISSPGWWDWVNKNMELSIQIWKKLSSD